MIWTDDTTETLCGVGSTIAFTGKVRAWLPSAVERLGVRTLLDAPCGDRNWIRTIALPCDYIGVDHEPQLVARAADDGANVILADIRSDELPVCDAILSRDFFQHLSVSDAADALANMAKTGAKWLIATCHGQSGDDISTGGFRYVDMRAHLGAPIDAVEDGKHGRILGVWAL